MLPLQLQEQESQDRDSQSEAQERLEQPAAPQDRDPPLLLAAHQVLHLLPLPRLQRDGLRALLQVA